MNTKTKYLTTDIFLFFLIIFFSIVIFYPYKKIQSNMDFIIFNEISEFPAYPFPKPVPTNYIKNIKVTNSIINTNK